METLVTPAHTLALHRGDGLPEAQRDPRSFSIQNVPVAAHDGCDSGVMQHLGTSGLAYTVPTGIVLSGFKVVWLVVLRVHTVGQGC